MKKLKLLLHVPESERFEAALKQARNFALAMGDKPYEIIILVNFEGVTVIEKFSTFTDLFKEVLNFGIKIFFCENALKAFNIPLEMVPKETHTVSAGILALVEWQEEGFRYVRA
ncbi:MAG: DsrE family protein [Caldimicrobium sp.]